jgi:hypothetical protein
VPSLSLTGEGPDEVGTEPARRAGHHRRRSPVPTSAGHLDWIGWAHVVSLRAWGDGQGGWPLVCGGRQSTDA